MHVWCQVDKIFKAAAFAACAQRIPLAKLAVEETSMGIVEDKVRPRGNKQEQPSTCNNITVYYLA